MRAHLERPRSDSGDLTLDTVSSLATEYATAGHAALRRLARAGDNRSVATSCGFKIFLTRRMILTVLLAATAVSFSVGVASKTLLLSQVVQFVPDPRPADGIPTRVALPDPSIVGGKDVPLTTYASRTFLQEGAGTSHTVHLDRRGGMTNWNGSSSGDEGSAAEAPSPSVVRTVDDSDDDDSSDDSSDDDDGSYGDEDPANDEGTDTDDSSDDSSDDDEAGRDEDLHLPAGQHLLVDIKGADPDFLDSESRLASAMVELTTETGLTLLSYHCHSLTPSGVSCAGVLLESHVAFHTWPKHGAIVMDLFTCGSGLLIPILPLIRNLFAVPSAPDAEPSFVWSHKLRGFRQGFSPSYDELDDPLREDLGYLYERHNLEMREEVVSERTAFQRVDVVEYVDPERSLAQYARSLSDDGSYESRNPELYKPEKVLYLDGIEQSSLEGDAAYHEALVHPAMLAHPHPKRVAIVGGGEGATLREVLKHDTVEEAVMVEIDGELVGICREHLPEWTDCSDLVGGDGGSCFDDPRATLAIEDAFAWFEDRFGDGGGDREEERFDVIIMDALDPERTVEIAFNLYKGSFVEALYNGLSEDGVFVVQMGQTADIQDPAEAAGPDKDKASMMNALEAAGFVSMHRYDEGHSSFGSPWNYLVSLKDARSRAGWYRTAAETDLQLRRRLRGTRSGRPPLRFFDASTMAGYQLPSRGQETVHCRREDGPPGCDDRRADGGVGEGEAEEAVAAFHVPPSTLTVLDGLREERTGDGSVGDGASAVLAFAEEGCGYGVTLLGQTYYPVGASANTLRDHGHGGAHNCGLTNFTEADRAPDGTAANAFAAYDPVLERHLRQNLAMGGLARRNIKLGRDAPCS